jgi:uncharacterized membrane protein
MGEDRSRDGEAAPSSEIVKKVERKIEQSARERLSKTHIPSAEQLAQEIAAQSADDVVEVAMAFSGPVPPPSIMEGWERVLPGSADRILKMAEKQQDADISLTERKLDRDDAFRTKGLYLGAGLILLLLALAGFALWTAQPWVASAILGGGFIAVIVAYFNMTRGLAQREGWRAPPSQGPSTSS